MFTLQQKRFKCFRQFEKMHSEKNIKTEEETVSTENRNSHQRCSLKKDVLKNFTEFTGRPATLLKRDPGFNVIY